MADETKLPNEDRMRMICDHLPHELAVELYGTLARERQYAELVAAIEAHPDVQFVLKKPVGDGFGASRRVAAALAALSPVSPSPAEPTKGEL